ncbi:BadF/BadG/BcrA/BcrD ATPase family protein, partial [Actinomycetospora atypica]
MSLVAVDLGRSGARVVHPGGRRVTTTGAGLGDPGGAGGVAAVLRGAVGDIPPGPWSLAVGVPGAMALPDDAAELAEALTGGWARPPDEVAVTSDVVAWHAGAFDGGSGVVLVVGTGAVALGVSPAGALRRVDGHGLLLGDEGGGARIGQDGLRAALRALDDAGPATTLTGPARDLQARGRPGTATDLASSSPAGLDAAAAGDAVATEIVGKAVDALVTTAGAAGTGPVALVGELAAALAAPLRAAGLALHAP